MVLGFILMVLDHILRGSEWGWFKEIFFCPFCLLNLQFMKYSFNFLFSETPSVHVMHATASVQLKLAGLFQCSFPGFGQCCSKHFIVKKWRLTGGF